jgi:hypothetical protein
VIDMAVVSSQARAALTPRTLQPSYRFYRRVGNFTLGKM